MRHLPRAASRFSSMQKSDNSTTQCHLRLWQWQKPQQHWSKTKPGGTKIEIVVECSREHSTNKIGPTGNQAKTSKKEKGTTALRRLAAGEPCPCPQSQGNLAGGVDGSPISAFRNEASATVTLSAPSRRGHPRRLGGGKNGGVVWLHLVSFPAERPLRYCHLARTEKERQKFWQVDGCMVDLPWRDDDGDETKALLADKTGVTPDFVSSYSQLAASE